MEATDDVSRSHRPAHYTLVAPALPAASIGLGAAKAAARFWV